MSQRKKKVVTTNTNKKQRAQRVVTSSERKRSTPDTPSRRKKKETEPMLFGKKNYMLMLLGAGVIMLGLFLMSGGSMPDPNTWDPDIIYSTRRTLIAPVVILTGLVIEIFAIFK